MSDKKKVSLQELVQKKLNDKKQQQEEDKVSSKPTQTKGMKSQLAKKPSTTRRKMGS